MSKFRVNDTVHSFVYGKGTISHIVTTQKLPYPIEVDFGNEKRWYTEEGRFFIGANIDLFFAEPKFSNYDEMMNRPKWKPKEDEFYYYVNTYGVIDATSYSEKIIDPERFKIGNCFETIKEAKESKFYKVFHEEE